MKTEPPKRNSKKGTPTPASVTAHRQYDSRLLQERAWAYVQAALEDGAIKLEDYQADRGIGADGAIDWQTFVEMKSFGREAPSEVTFTESEYLRAKERKGKFLLVVVSGLQEGFETEIRVYADPLGTLPWVPKGAVSIGGLESGRAILLSERTIDSPSQEATAEVMRDDG